MKRFFSLLILLLIPALSACSSAAVQPYETLLADNMLDSGAFSETLAPLDADVLWTVYGLGDSGLKREALTDARSYRSTGATCEEVSVLLFIDEASAQAAEKVLKDYLTGQIASNRDYRPAELPKLEKAVIRRRDHSLVMLVAAHYDMAADLLN